MVKYSFSSIFEVRNFYHFLVVSSPIPKLIFTIPNHRKRSICFVHIKYPPAIRHGLLKNHPFMRYYHTKNLHFFCLVWGFPIAAFDYTKVYTYIYIYIYTYIYIYLIINIYIYILYINIILYILIYIYI